MSATLIKIQQTTSAKTRQAVIIIHFSCEAPHPPPPFIFVLFAQYEQRDYAR